MDELKLKNHIVIPKRVREYMIELLSMFIAVILAFISQYFFQYKLDRSTEHDLMESMVADLRTDIKNIDSLQSKLPEVLKKSDDLDEAFRSDYKSLANQKAIYSAFYQLILYKYQVDLSTSTINQLKNSGGLHLLLNKDVSNAIVDYDNEIHHLNIYEANLGSRKQMLLNDEINVLYPRAYKNYVIDTRFIEETYRKNGTAFISMNFETVMHFNNIIQNFTLYCLGYGRYCNTQKAKAEKLISLIKSRYHLE